jgi:hypothetical protein
MLSDFFTFAGLIVTVCLACGTGGGVLGSATEPLTGFSTAGVFCLTITAAAFFRSSSIKPLIRIK